MRWRCSDPSCLKPIIDELRQRVPSLAHADGELSVITRRIIAADGTYLTTLAEVAWRCITPRATAASRARCGPTCRLDVATWTPQVVSISGNDDTSEPAAFARDLLESVLYVIDRNFLPA